MEKVFIYQSLNDIVGISEIGATPVFAHGYVSGCDAVINRKLFEVVPCFPLESEQLR